MVAFFEPDFRWLPLLFVSWSRHCLQDCSFSVMASFTTYDETFKHMFSAPSPIGGFRPLRRFNTILEDYNSRRVSTTFTSRTRFRLPVGTILTCQLLLGHNILPQIGREDNTLEQEHWEGTYRNYSHNALASEGSQVTAAISQLKEES